MIALDTNLLIYAHRTGLPENKPAQRAIVEAAQHPNGWGFALASVVEFWSIVTHPTSAGGAAHPEQARDFLAALVEAGARICLPGESFGERLAQLAADLKVQGPKIFDLQIALTVFDCGASEIWTHDAGFVRFAGLRQRDPLAK